MATINKQVAEQITYAFEFKDKLPTGASLASGTLSAIDVSDNSDQSTVVLDSTTATISGTQARFRAKAGTDGSKYKITLVATLDNNDKLEEDVILSVGNI